MYINCKTYYSFRYGTYKTEELVVKAAEQGINTLVLTNINNTCDEWEFIKHCHTHKIKPVIGAEIRNDDTVAYTNQDDVLFTIVKQLFNELFTRHLPGQPL